MPRPGSERCGRPGSERAVQQLDEANKARPGKQMILRAARELLDDIGDLIVSRRARNDVRKMQDLQHSFVDSVYEIAKKDGYSEALNAIEVTLLGTFVVSEIYLGLSAHKPFAEDALDEFHKRAAERLFNMNLEITQRQFPKHDVSTLYDQFMEQFDTRAKERYAEYRSIMLDERGLFKRSNRATAEIGKHCLEDSFAHDHKIRESVIFMIGLLVLDHMVRCTKSFK